MTNNYGGIDHIYYFFSLLKQLFEIISLQFQSSTRVNYQIGDIDQTNVDQFEFSAKFAEGSGWERKMFVNAV